METTFVDVPEINEYLIKLQGSTETLTRVNDTISNQILQIDERLKTHNSKFDDCLFKTIPTATVPSS